MSASDSSSPIPLVPAPWKLKGCAWAFLVSAPKSKASFPAGWATEYQADALAAGGDLAGGPSMVQVLSYEESPVGPYQELVYIPGRWKYADGTKASRITQIYVSTKESTFNGRKNWNVPKHVAEFSITTDTSGTTHIAVTHPGDDAPFFKASVRRIPVLSTLPIYTNTALLGKFCTLRQPPLPAGPAEYDVSTDKWVSLLPVLRGSASLRRMVPEMECIDGTRNTEKVVGDGKGFPALVPWSIGFALENMNMDFGLPTIHERV